jgi:hypothetical protein
VVDLGPEVKGCFFFACFTFFKGWCGLKSQK